VASGVPSLIDSIRSTDNSVGKNLHGEFGRPQRTPREVRSLRTPELSNFPKFPCPAPAALVQVLQYSTVRSLVFYSTRYCMVQYSTVVYLYRTVCSVRKRLFVGFTSTYEVQKVAVIVLLYTIVIIIAALYVIVCSNSQRLGCSTAVPAKDRCFAAS
jgi:hypothetical protein